ncbi:MAG: hypothetical protein AAFP76_10730 [Bacteroidota bacterium]
MATEPDAFADDVLRFMDRNKKLEQGIVEWVAGYSKLNRRKL